MSEPQIWTLIGVFAAVMIGGMTLMFRLMTTTLSAKFDGLEAKFDAKFDTIDVKFDAVNESIIGLRNEMNARFEVVDVRMGHLDRDVQALSKRVFEDRE